MSGRRWTPEEDAELKRLYPHFSTALIAPEFGRTRNQLYHRAKKLGVRKSAAYVAEAKAAAGQRLEIVGIATRLRPGNVPANKGKRMSPEIRAKCAPTMFKPGRPPELASNYAPIGSTRIVYGNLERKVTDDPSIYPARRWRPVHRLVWEAAHGPVPPGHVVVFRRGRHTTIEAEITLDRLECISRRENMRRNSVHNYPEPLKRVIRAKAQLVREINKRTRA